MLWGVESRLLIFANWLPRSHREGPTARLCSGVPCCTTRFAPVTYLACLWVSGVEGQIWEGMAAMLNCVAAAYDSRWRMRSRQMRNYYFLVLCCQFGRSDSELGGLEAWIVRDNW
jgi:hypothetical protein